MTTIAVLANRGDIGGGELMQLRLVAALRELGHSTRVVAPARPGDLTELARSRGLETVVVGGGTRAAYARALRRWARRERPRECLVWCNGLLPAVATAGLPGRVVHLHQEPTGRQRPLASLARLRAHATVVPSDYLGRSLRGTLVLPNWTDELAMLPPPAVRPEGQARVSVGSLGRIGREKGTDVLAHACTLLSGDVRRRLRLVVAGDDRFVPAADRAVVDAALAAAEASGVTVERPGWVEPTSFFGDVDVVVLPSVRAESFGLGAAEAMASGRPVVVSDAGGLPEVAGPGHPWLASAGDAHSLAMALTNAIAALPADDVVAAQRARWTAEYSPAAGMRHLEELMERLLVGGALETSR